MVVVFLCYIASQVICTSQIGCSVLLPKSAMAKSSTCSSSAKLKWTMALLVVLVSMIRVHGQPGNTTIQTNSS